MTASYRHYERRPADTTASPTILSSRVREAVSVQREAARLGLMIVAVPGDRLPAWPEGRERTVQHALKFAVLVSAR